MGHKYDIDPDDHGACMTRCPRCNQRYHASEVHECEGETDDDFEPLNERWGEGEFDKVIVDVRESNNNLIIETQHLETRVNVSVSFI